VKLGARPNIARDYNTRRPALWCNSDVMNTREQALTGAHFERAGLHGRSIHQGHARSIPFVTRAETKAIGDAIAAGMLPVDFEGKLRSLAGGDILQQNIEKNCRRFISLLQADHEGLFTELTPAQRQHLLEVLAYVRKDDDAIPDYRHGGYVDDQGQVRGATLDLGPALEHFNLWRLRYQVPELWRITVSEHATTHVLQS
jgi:hypothetical protein